jgi:putative molybdopterin biosynthesis protein
MEHGGEPLFLGISRDSPSDVINMIKKGIETADIVLSSGSTSAGVSDVVYQVIEEFEGPGIIAHGLKIAPGKPTVIAVVKDKPYIGLPGNPSSCINSFNLIVAPLIRKLSGVGWVEEVPKVKATAKVRIQGEVGRRIFQGVNLLKKKGHLYVYPLLSGSGAVKTLGSADGFVEIDAKTGYIDEGSTVIVTLLSEKVVPAQFVIFGSHSVKMEKIFAMIKEIFEIPMKFFSTGSIAAVNALKRGESDVAGVAIIDSKTGIFNEHLIERYNLPESVRLIRGFERNIGFVVKRGNPKNITGFNDIFRDDVFFVNQANNTEGREIIEYLLRVKASEMDVFPEELKLKINGYDFIVRDYISAMAAVLNERGDIAIVPEELVQTNELEFIPLTRDRYDLLVNETEENKEILNKLVEYLKL